MSELPQSAASSGDELDPIDVYEFFREGWQALVATTVLGGVVGLTIAFVLPEKYISSALIQPTRTAGTEVENIKILAEKMRSPTYYSEATRKACPVDDSADLNQALPRNLAPKAARDSSFVAISFKARSTVTAEACLSSVLSDVVRNQAIMARPELDRIKNDIALTEQRLKTSLLRQEQDLVQNKERLANAQAKLISAQKFISEFQALSVNFNFKDERFSASSLMLATVLSKQAEINDLQLLINDLERQVRSSLTGREEELLGLKAQIVELKRSLLSPTTEEARFATPIHSPSRKVEPKRALIITVALMGGLFSGVMFLLLRQALSYARARRKTPHEPVSVA